MTTTTETVDAAVRTFIMDLSTNGAAMELQDLREQVEQLVVSHPDVGRVAVQSRGTKGAGLIRAYDPNDVLIAKITIRANGEVDALPADASSASATPPPSPARSFPTPQQLQAERIAAEEAKKARGRGTGTAARKRATHSDRAVALAAAAKALGGPAFKTPIGAGQVESVLKTLGDRPPLDVFGVAEKTARAWAIGGKPAGKETTARVRDFAKQTGDRLVWGRKLGLILLAIHTEATS